MNKMLQNGFAELVPQNELTVSPETILKQF